MRSRTMYIGIIIAFFTVASFGIATTQAYARPPEFPEVQVTLDGSDQMKPAISGNLITWLDQRSGSSEVYVYDLLSGNLGQRLPISNQAVPLSMDISGNLITWMDNRSGLNIYYCDYDD
ncbi:hypothetical protein ACFL38_04655 [Candidatus Omnitrophota bacterium]